MFLLDTDHIGIIQRRTEPEFNRLSIRMSRHALSDFYCSIISLQEQFLGWHTYINRARTTEGVTRGYRMFHEVLIGFSQAQVLPFDEAASGVLDSLVKQRVRIATLDLRIAAIALSRGLIVLTRNIRDFRKVPGLRVEDWTA